MGVIVNWEERHPVDSVSTVASVETDGTRRDKTRRDGRDGMGRDETDETERDETRTREREEEGKGEATQLGFRVNPPKLLSTYGILKG